MSSNPMNKPAVTDPRGEIVRRIAESRDEFQPEQCEALFHLTCEDLIAGGVDAIRVKAAMLRAFVRQQVTERGAGATAELLRDFADRVERPALEN
jgi:hypothetical protein